LVLLPRWTKENAVVLVTVCVMILAGHWLDLCVAILPSCSNTAFTLSLWDIGLPVGALAAYVLVWVTALRRAPVVPLRDPFLEESLAAAD
jgi:hypothetical protein